MLLDADVVLHALAALPSCHPWSVPLDTLRTAQISKRPPRSLSLLCSLAVSADVPVWQKAFIAWKS